VGWTDDVEDLPLEYGFEVRSDANPVPEALAELLRSPRLLTNLPVGNLVTSVAVFDFYGATAVGEAAIDVEEPTVEELEGVIQRTIRDAEQAVETGASSRAKQLVTLVAQLPQFRSRPANESVALISIMLRITGAATNSSLSTPTSRNQAANSLSAVLADPEKLDGAARSEGISQVAGLASEAASSGIDVSTALNLLSAMDNVLEAGNATSTASAVDAQVNRLAARTARGLGSAFLAGAVTGEQTTEALSNNVNISAARSEADELANGTRTGPGGAGAVGVPLSTFDVLQSVDVADGVDLIMINYARNVHGDPANQTAVPGETADLGDLQTGVFSVTLSTPGAGVLNVSGLEEPILIAVPFTPGGTAAGSAPCGSSSDCTGVGACESGVCACPAPFYGSRCEFQASCHFWDEDAERWSSAGCTTVPTPTGGDANTLYCLCTHLTDFAGIEVPTSEEELQGDLGSFTVNTFSAEEAAAVLKDIDAQVILDNPVIYGLVIGMSIACALTVAIFCAKDHAESKERKMRLAAEAQAELAASQQAIERQAQAIEARLDNLDAFVGEHLHGAAVTIQRFARGRVARKRMAKIVAYTAGIGKGTGDHSLTKVFRDIRERLLADHTLFGLWYGDAEESKRSELCQIFWSTGMLGLVIECMLYDTSGGAPEEGGEAFVEVNIVHALLASFITASLAIPSMAIYNAIFTWGYARGSPLGDRVSKKLLGGDAADTDKQLVARAKTDFVVKVTSSATGTRAIKAAVSETRLKRQESRVPKQSSPVSKQGSRVSGIQGCASRVTPGDDSRGDPEAACGPAPGLPSRPSALPTTRLPKLPPLRGVAGAPAARGVAGRIVPVTTGAAKGAVSPTEVHDEDRANRHASRDVGSRYSATADASAEAEAAAVRVGSSRAAAVPVGRSSGDAVQPPRARASPPAPPPSPPFESRPDPPPDGVLASSAAGSDAQGARPPPPAQKPAPDGFKSRDVHVPAPKATPLGMGMVARLMKSGKRAAQNIADRKSAWKDKRRLKLLALEDVDHDLDENTVRQLRAKFIKYDKDDSGLVSAGELGALLADMGFTATRARVRKLAKELDVTGEGSITLAEFVVWYDLEVKEAIHREMRRQKGWRRHWARFKERITPPWYIRIALCWASVWAIYVALALIAVVYARLFGPETTRLMLFSWTLAEFQTLTLEEPILIALGILIPFLIDALTSNEYMAELVNVFMGTSVGACLKVVCGACSS